MQQMNPPPPSRSHGNVITESSNTHTRPINCQGLATAILHLPETQENKSKYNFSRTLTSSNLPINRLKRAEVQGAINSLNPNKSSGYDLITGNVLK
jgi:hypothetical protein